MSNYKKAVLLLILANIIWGAGSPIFKWAFEGISPLTLAFLRFCIPVIILLPFFKHFQRIRMRDAFFFVLLGLLNCTINIGLYFIGLQYTSSINQPIIASAGPVFVILGSAFFLRDKAKRKVLLGNLIGLTGVLLIVVEPLMVDHHYSSFLGNSLFVLSTISGSLGTLVSKRLANRYNTPTLIFWTFVVAALSLLPATYEQMVQHTFLTHIDMRGVIGVLFGGLFSSLIAYAFFFYGLKYIKASETSVFSYIDPVAAILIAGPLLQEYPTPIFIIGSLLVFFGIYIAEGRIHWHPLHKLF